MTLTPGDRIPNFQLPALDGLKRVFYFELKGGPVIMFIARNNPSLSKAAFRESLKRTEIFAQNNIELVSVLDDRSFQGDLDCSGVVFRDDQGKLLELLLTRANVNNKPDAAFLVLDSNQRLVRIVDIIDISSSFDSAIQIIIEYLNRPVPSPVTLQYGAPVLLMENLLAADVCDRLIQTWKNDHREGLVNDGRFNAPDSKIKKNREHEIVDSELRSLISRTIGPRIGAELEKVFNFSQPLRFEAFTILSYTDERSDFFGPHRDNLRQTQKRRFAMSLNLNDTYDGGELCFPEYGSHKYLPPAGAGVIFSCSLLHEALPVTKGQRWVLVTFMCD